MKANLLEVVASQIASQILKEDFKITDEESRQDALAKQIDKDDLRASEKAETEELTDEGDEEGDDDKDEKEIEAKPKPDAEDEDRGEEDFEVQAPDVIPDLISYGQIEKQINNLRAGKSLKDEEISSALEDYFSFSICLFIISYLRFYHLLSIHFAGNYLKCRLDLRRTRTASTL